MLHEDLLSLIQHHVSGCKISQMADELDMKLRDPAQIILLATTAALEAKLNRSEVFRKRGGVMRSKAVQNGFESSVE